MTRIILGIGVLTLGVAVAAQVKDERPSLGTIAKAAQEEKAKAAQEEKAKAAAASKPESKAPTKPDGAAAAASEGKTEKPGAKKYTNEDLGRPRPSAPLYLSAPPATPYRADRPKDEAYWRSRAEPILQRQKEIASYLTRLKARLESIKGDGLDVSLANGQSSPLATERRQLTSQVADFEAQQKRLDEMMAALEDEGRRGGALPGWFR